MKKVISILLIFVLVLGMIPTAFAAGTPAVTMTADKTSVSAGETVTVTVSINEAISNLMAFQFNLYFDDAMFTKTSATVGTASSKTTVGEKRTDSKGAFLAISGLDTLGQPIALASGEIASITFTANEGVSAEKVNFELAVDAMTDYDTFEEVPVSAPEKVEVSVTEKPVDPEYTVTMPEDKAVVAGETVEIPVTVGYTTTAQDKYNAIDMQFSYDASILELTSTTIEGLTVTAGEGAVRVQGYGADKSFETKAATLKFKAIGTGEATVTAVSAKVDASAHAISADAPEAKLLDAATVVTVSGYTVALPEEFEGESTVAPGEDYTFTAKDKNYDYTFEGTTMGGENAIVKDNGDGTFTIEDVNGNIVIKTEKTGKKFSVTLGTDMTGETEAQYMKNYTATLTQEDGYTYSVTVEIGGTVYGGYSVSEGKYTIPGEDITGEIVFTVTKTEIPATSHKVEFKGNGAGDLAEGTADTVEDGETYSFLINEAEGYVYTVTATMGGETATVKAGESAGTYTIENVTGDLVITVEKESDLKVEVNSFVELDGKTVFLVTATGTLPEGKIFSYDGTAMFYSEAYEAYCFLTIVEEGVSFTAEDAKAKVTQTEATKETLAKENLDVNESGVVDINDAQLTYDIYNGKYIDFTEVTMAKFLRADVNASKNVNVEDATKIIAGIK